MPWPFPTKERPVSACRDALGSGASCLGFWRRDLQVAAGLLLGVAVGCFVLKVCNALPLHAMLGCGRLKLGCSGYGLSVCSRPREWEWVACAAPGESKWEGWQAGDRGK